jgi:cobaltochelatase CobN
VDVYQEEWLRRKMRNSVHLTKAGCLGPCVLANVASLFFDRRSICFHSVNSLWHVRRIFEYIDSMLKVDRFLQPPEDLLEYVINFYDWGAGPQVPFEGTKRSTDEIVQSIALLSHADTDLVTLANARSSLPEGLTVFDYSLNALRSEEQTLLRSRVHRRFVSSERRRLCFLPHPPFMCLEKAAGNGV